MDPEVLVREHLQVVGYVVREMLGRLPAHVCRDDLAGAGMVGLTQAAAAYDPESGVPFARYASTRIRGALLDELRSMDWVSRGARSRGREVTRAEDELTTRLGRRPTDAEVAAAVGVAESEVDRRRADADRVVLSMDAADGAAGIEVADTDATPEERLLHSEQLGYLRAAMAALPERHRAVATGFYLEQRPMVELASELGVTESRISQLRSEAMALLRDGMNSQLDPHLVPSPRRPDGAVARRREAFYAQVAAQAATAGVVITRSDQPERLRSTATPPMGTVAAHGRTA